MLSFVRPRRSVRLCHAETLAPVIEGRLSAPLFHQSIHIKTSSLCPVERLTPAPGAPPPQPPVAASPASSRRRSSRGSGTTTTHKVGTPTPSGSGSAQPSSRRRTHCERWPIGVHEAAEESSLWGDPASDDAPAIPVSGVTSL